MSGSSKFPLRLFCRAHHLQDLNFPVLQGVARDTAGRLMKGRGKEGWRGLRVKNLGKLGMGSGDVVFQGKSCFEVD